MASALVLQAGLTAGASLTLGKTRCAPRVSSKRAAVSRSIATSDDHHDGSSSNEEMMSRRTAVVMAGSALLAAVSSSSVMGSAVAAESAPKGFSGHVDSVDNYAFLYPFGWQEIAMKGQDVVFKDVIEPLENVAVNIVKTDKTDLSELGEPKDVALALVERVLSSPSQKISLVDASEKEKDGKKYYTFEFVAKAPNYTRHALCTVAVAYGKFYTLTTGANQRRWSKMEEKLRSVAESFTTL